MPARMPGGNIPDYTRQQALNLFRVKRPWDAVRLAERRLAEQPDDAVARGMLAQALQHVTFVREPLRPVEWTSTAGHTSEVLLRRGLEEVTLGLSSRPDDPWLHYIRATI